MAAHFFFFFSFFVGSGLSYAGRLSTSFFAFGLRCGSLKPKRRRRLGSAAVGGGFSFFGEGGGLIVSLDIGDRALPSGGGGSSKGFTLSTISHESHDSALDSVSKPALALAMICVHTLELDSCQQRDQTIKKLYERCSTPSCNTGAGRASADTRNRPVDFVTASLTTSYSPPSPILCHGLVSF